MLVRALRPAASLALLAAVALPRELAEVELPRVPNGHADASDRGRFVVNLNNKGDVLVDRTDVAFGQAHVIESWKLVSKLVKLPPKELAAHVNQARRFFVELKQAAPPEWPAAPHVLMRLDRRALWKSLDTLLPILAKEKILDVRFAVELAKKKGELPMVLHAKVPAKTTVLRIEVAKGTDAAAAGKRIEAFAQANKGKRMVGVVATADKATVATVVGVLGRLVKAGITEIVVEPSAR